jgi:nicotinate-nucleotide adenylyltransferase
VSAPAPRVGIFGGSFDPVHNAHVALARLALSALRLDELLWVPAGQPWQKHRSVTPAEHRAAMVRLAIDDEPRFVLSQLELRRTGPSYTVDTLRELQAQRAGVEWFLVIGQDQYAHFDSWREWQAILGLVTLAIANRPDVPVAPTPMVASVPHEAVALPMMDISSTDIRGRIARHLGIDDLVPPAVARYIAQHDLYRETLPGS